MTTHSPSEVKRLQESALENLWYYLREPPDLAEKVRELTGQAVPR